MTMQQLRSFIAQCVCIMRYSSGHGLFAVHISEIHLQSDSITAVSQLCLLSHHKRWGYSCLLLRLLCQPGENKHVCSSYVSQVSFQPLSSCLSFSWVQQTVWTVRQLVSQTGPAIHHLSNFKFIILLQYYMVISQQ